MEDRKVRVFVSIPANQKTEEHFNLIVENIEKEIVDITGDKAFEVVTNKEFRLKDQTMKTIRLCDFAWFDDKWEKDGECKFEHMAADAFGTEILKD